MTLSQQYDEQKQETADRFREMDAVDEVVQDIVGLLKDSQQGRRSSIDDEEHEDLLEKIFEYVHYNESLEYILSQIPDKVKRLLVQTASRQDII